jgi:adenylate kinase family enzyme
MRRARADDDKVTIQKRIDTFRDLTTEVLQAYRKQGGKVAEVDATGDVEKVHSDILVALKDSGVSLDMSSIQ